MTGWLDDWWRWFSRFWEIWPAIVWYVTAAALALMLAAQYLFNRDKR